MFYKGNRWLRNMLCMGLSVAMMVPTAAYATADSSIYENLEAEVQKQISEDEPDASLESTAQETDTDNYDTPAVDDSIEDNDKKEPETEPDSPSESYTEGWVFVGDKKHWQYTDGSYACNTWITDAGKKYYLNENGDLTVGWKKLDYEYYFFKDGSLAVNQWIDKRYVDGNGRWDSRVIWHTPEWKRNTTGWWWQNEDGSYPKLCFKQINGRTYYFDARGYMVVGWKLLQNKWYYFDASGAMATGWKNIKNTWYYMNDSGVMATGWQNVKGVWYFLNESGAMRTGWLRSGASWYYLNPSGAMVTGWIKVTNTWYYMNNSGAMCTGWVKVNNTWYYMNSSGAMCTGWLKRGSIWYYLNGSGAMVTGWANIKGVWYYLNASGAMVTGWQQIDNTWYYFYGSGAMAANTWVGSYYLTPSGAWDASAASDNRYVWPCPGYTRISSDYGPRTRPTAGASSYHQGIDIAAPAGAIITTIHKGTVQSYGYNGTMGNYVKIDHGNGVVSVYMHMSRVGSIHTGMQVSGGTTIGYVGSSGVATGAHLHLATLQNGAYVSPWNYLSRP